MHIFYTVVCVFVNAFIYFETGSHYVAQAASASQVLRL
jgi:hypothetical protein